MSAQNQLTCPRCGRKNKSFYFRSHSSCPACGAKVHSDLKLIGIIESVVGLPILWIAASLLRTILNDSTGVLSYTLLIVPALAIHVFVVRYFVTIKLVDD